MWEPHIFVGRGISILRQIEDQELDYISSMTAPVVGPFPLPFLSTSSSSSYRAPVPSAHYTHECLTHCRSFSSSFPSPIQKSLSTNVKSCCRGGGGPPVLVVFRSLWEFVSYSSRSSAANDANPTLVHFLTSNPALLYTYSMTDRLPTCDANNPYFSPSTWVRWRCVVLTVNGKHGRRFKSNFQSARLGLYC